MVDHARWLFCPVLLPAFLREPLPSSSPLNIRILNIEDFLPIPAEHCRRDTGATRRIGKSFRCYARTACIRGINESKPLRHCLHGTVGNMIDENRCTSLFRQGNNLNQPRWISGISPTDVHSDRNIPRAGNLKDHAQLCLVDGNAHVIQQDANAKTPLIKALEQQPAHLFDLGRCRFLNKGSPALHQCHAAEEIRHVAAFNNFCSNSKVSDRRPEVDRCPSRKMLSIGRDWKSAGFKIKLGRDTIQHLDCAAQAGGRMTMNVDKARRHDLTTSIKHLPA